jgi:2-dehydro-3-deoxyphosphogluconate aldolase/(4S)-4-hydroxy-2-oxoglutarate aldolase
MGPFSGAAVPRPGRSRDGTRASPAARAPPAGRREITTEPLALERLRAQRLIAVIRAPTPEAALGAARAVAAGGVRLIEITFTVPDAPQVIAALAHEPGLTVGAGTVLTALQARDALAAGARFIVAPNLSRAVAAEALGAGVMYCPGAYTTTEILAALEAGAHVVKVYPVGVAGGPAYIRVIRDPLPDAPLLAAGGTTLENVPDFLRAGCVGAGLGAALADPALAAAGRFEEIERRARAFAGLVDAPGARPGGA